jgi:hypothetical protein
MSRVDQWIERLEAHHLDGERIEIELAREIAVESRIGWYVAPHGDGWGIGKTTLGMPPRRYCITCAAGNPMRFSSVDEALRFFRVELNVLTVAMFQD